MNSDAIDQERVRQHFSGHAFEYDQFAIVQKQVARELVDLLPDRKTSDGRTVLDVGTGTGEVLLNYRQRFGCGDRLIGLDLSPDMCRMTESRLPGVETLVGDAQALPVASGSCDLVLSSAVYQWMNDLPAAFGDAARVLRPGGLFAFALFGEQTLYELKHAYRLALGQNGNAVLDYTQEFPCQRQVRDALQAHMWESVSLSQKKIVEWHPDPATMLKRLKKIGAHNASAKRPGGLAPRSRMKAMLDNYQQRFGDTRGVPATYDVIVGVARRVKAH